MRTPPAPAASTAATGRRASPGPPTSPAPPACAARDRDTEGKARNARPRDGLGRPLPYGREGVARQPEGVVRTPEVTLTEAQRLLEEGKPFHAHEVLEDAWKTSPPGEQAMWKGLAQLAVGVTHLARGNTKGGARLLLRGAEGIEPYGDDPPHGVDVAGVARWARATADEVNARTADGAFVVRPPSLRETGRRLTIARPPSPAVTS